MIVPPELQDLPETMAPESNASSSTRDNSGDHPTSPSSSSSSEETPSRKEGTGDVVGNVSDRPVVGEWENKVLTGRLSNLCKAPKDLPAGFRFRATLHHEVAESVPSVSGLNKLEDLVKAYHIPRTILLRAGGKNERACTVSRMGWSPVYVDNFEAGLRFPLPGLVFDLLADYDLALTQLTPNSIRFIIGFMLLCARLEVPAKAIVFRSLFQCRLCPNSCGAKWYYLSKREKSQLFKNVKNKVARWKRQFIFIRDTRTERINNDLAARLSEWRVPNAHVNYPQLLPRDTDLKNQLLEHARKENLIDLDALVTSEQLAVFEFVDVENLFTEAYWNASTNEPRVPKVARLVARNKGRHGLTSGHPQHHNHAARHTVDRARRQGHTPISKLRLWPPMHAGVHRAPTVAARSSNPPSATARAVAKPASASTTVSAPRIAYPNGFSYVKPDCQPAMVQGMQSFVPPVDRQRARAFVQQHVGQAAMVKLMDAFSYAVALFKSEQGARSQNNELNTNCKQLAVEKASHVDDVNRLQGSKMANRVAAMESRAEELANRNNELREELERARAEKESGIQAARDEAARVEEWAKKAEAERDRALNELGSLRFQVAEADKNLNATKEALNELKASHARSVSIARAQGAEWLAGSATFQDVVAVASANMTTEIYNEIRGKVLHHRPDFPIRELEPSSTLPNSQPVVVPARSPINVPAPEPAAHSPPARSTPPTVDASMPVDLTDD
ncbi:hypothetical protein SLEP1_g30299 [Rubroshorea leprosula]|uniref:Transposase (putative) gypsy type domain-containing protein n=1 Tax=Rubroshorea leprosula TaxID=152421 RepID=A0AAV5K858_9ROSI|nr:hypothetical protein SLEP1_g30299 [Rubroshorea leprosula]